MHTCICERLIVASALEYTCMQIQLYIRSVFWLRAEGTRKQESSTLNTYIKFDLWQQ